MIPTPPTPPDTHPVSLKMLWWAARNPPLNPSTSFAGKHILITGCTVGLGYETLLKLASLKASRLIMGVRSLARGEITKTEICQRTGYLPENIAVYSLDMARFESVKEFVEIVKIKEERIDAVILNAGISPAAYEKCEDGWEMSLKVNVLSTALLAISLLPHLHTSSHLSNSPSHLEIIGSTGYFGISPTDLNDTKPFLSQTNEREYFNIRRQYMLSKLFILYVVEGLISTYEKQYGNDKEEGNVIIAIVCPGLCRTNLGRSFNSFFQTLNTIFQLGFARGAEEGARSIVSGITLGYEAHGGFWTHDVLFR